jgi:hypothetical protein
MTDTTEPSPDDLCEVLQEVKTALRYREHTWDESEHCQELLARIDALLSSRIQSDAATIAELRKENAQLRDKLRDMPAPHHVTSPAGPPSQAGGSPRSHGDKGMTEPSVAAPKRIYLLDYGSYECTWCEDPDPSGEDHSSVEYVRADMLDEARAVQHMLTKEAAAKIADARCPKCGSRGDDFDYCADPFHWQTTAQAIAAMPASETKP